jgi:hypothetical protein
MQFRTPIAGRAFAAHRRPSIICHRARVGADEDRWRSSRQTSDTIAGSSHKNKDAADRQEQLDISKAQAEYVVEPDRVADQFCWEAAAMVQVWRLLHSSIFAQDRAVRQTWLL